MVINRNSWHYKMQMCVWEDEAKSLCQYFRRLVFAPFAFVLQFVVPILAILIFYVTLAPYDAIARLDITNLAKARYKAWRDGVCPMIEYVGEKPGGEKSDTPATAS